MWLGSGRLVNPWDLAPHLDRGDVRLEDIAHALARINRWTGHTRETISVGAHTLVCAETARRKSRRLGLLALHHEDGEAFFNDLPWAIKRHPNMRAYRDAEHRATEQCIAHFCPSLRGVALAAIKPIDTAAVMWEMDRFLPADRDPWDHPAPEAALVPERPYWTWTADRVAAEWLRLHAELSS